MYVTYILAVIALFNLVLLPSVLG